MADQRGGDVSDDDQKDLQSGGGWITDDDDVGVTDDDVEELEQTNDQSFGSGAINRLLVDEVGVKKQEGDEQEDGYDDYLHLFVEFTISIISGLYNLVRLCFLCFVVCCVVCLLLCRVIFFLYYHGRDFGDRMHSLGRQFMFQAIFAIEEDRDTNEVGDRIYRLGRQFIRDAISVWNEEDHDINDSGDCVNRRNGIMLQASDGGDEGDREFGRNTNTNHLFAVTPWVAPPPFEESIAGQNSGNNSGDIRASHETQWLKKLCLKLIRSLI